eukprot:TRINITY_DN5619_c0_g1_i1.p1 TRINITY_DN5619_c0_g1~~TRINITY_DN5619_c0_g1_i1.p1  ORF type:complete len:374 (+),score=102.74 TRINITY_DN5619_c0_g1_i1:241-1362(+)
MANNNSETEIERALNPVSVEVLKEILKVGNVNISRDGKSKIKLVRTYEEAVLNTGILKFIDRIGGVLRQEVYKCLLKSDPKLSFENQNFENSDALLRKIQDMGIEVLIGMMEDELLTRCCKIMGLDKSIKPEMEKQLIDEIMLTGTEAFLTSLPEPVLEKHCKEMNLKINADFTRGQLVECIMVEMFSLVPLGETSTSTQTNTPKSPKNPKKRKGGEEEEELFNENEPGIGTKKALMALKLDGKYIDGKYVAPPLETIQKGKYTATGLRDNFNLTDLQQYCKDRGILSSGKKPELIKRIMRYLDTGEKEEVKKHKKKKGVQKKRDQDSEGGGKNLDGAENIENGDNENESDEEENGEPGEGDEEQSLVDPTAS